jgi:hypothetical protein
MAQNANWLDAADWKWAQDTLPIACADVVPVRMGSDGRTIQKIGLIYRDTPHQGKRWCIVGGRMWRNESLAETASRQLLARIIHERFGVHRPGRLKALRWAFGLICANRPLPPKVNRVLLGQAEEVNSRLCWAMVW